MELTPTFHVANIGGRHYRIAQHSLLLTELVQARLQKQSKKSSSENTDFTKNSVFLVESVKNQTSHYNGKLIY